MTQVKSGSFRTYGYSDTGWPDHYVFSWSLVSQSIEGNYSDISWSLYASGTNVGNGNFTNVKEKYVTVNGSTQSNATIQTTYSGTTPFSGTARIYHNSVGEGSFGASAGGAFFYYGSYNSTGSGEWDLPTIPRASSVSGGSGNIGASTTISISRASSSFTHTLEYTFGSLTGTIATGVGTSYNWTIPTSFYSQIPNSNSGTGTITCKTYSGSTLVGTKTCSFTAKVTNSNPTVGTFTYKDSNSTTTAITGNNQRIIRNNSNLVFTLGTATAKNSASISKYEVTFNSVTKSRTSAGDLDFGIINLSSNATATLKVTDSRGNTATRTITVIIDDWILPSALISLNRKNNFYSETYLKVDGTYSSLNSKNSMTIRYRYKKVSESSYSSLISLNDNEQVTLDFDNEYQWNIEVHISDKIGTTAYNLVLDRGMPIAYFDRLNSAVGINAIPKSGEALKVAKGNMILDGNVTVRDVKCKNLFNKDNAQVGTINWNSTEEALTDSFTSRTSEWISCKPNTYYTIQGGNSRVIQYKNSSGTITFYSDSIDGTSNVVTFLTSTDAIYFRITVISNITYYSLDDVQIEEGTTASEYTRYKDFGLTISPIQLTFNDNYVYSSDRQYNCFRIGRMVFLQIYHMAFKSIPEHGEYIIYGLPKPVNGSNIFYLYGGNLAKGDTCRCYQSWDTGDILVYYGSPSHAGDSANNQYAGILIYETRE